MSAPEFAEDTVVVGVDGSESALQAVRWAAEAAARHHVPLRIVHAFGVTGAYYGGDSGVPTTVFDAMSDEAKKVLADAVGPAREVAGDLALDTVLQSEPPIPSLIEESRHARMVVLGASGRGEFAGLFTGSVAVAVTSHGECPVVVVRPREGQARPPDEGPVVVGVDGSPISERAVAVAFDEAARLGAPLLAVHSWMDTEPYSAVDRARGRFEGDDEVNEQRLLAERLAGWQETYPDVAVERVVVRDRPRRQLLDQAKTARLVVVGSRGRGGFRGILLGSTSQALVHHAACPVMVVRPRPRNG